MSTGYPDEVPVLEPSDICRGRYSKVNGRCCLIGWARHVFGEFGSPQFKKAEKALVAAIRLHATGYGAVEDFNDDSEVSLKRVAKVWNLAMATLGYTVGNPAAKQVKR